MARKHRVSWQRGLQGFREFLSVVVAALLRPETRLVVGAPAISALVVFLLALWRAPEITSDNQRDFANFYGTTGQVVATLFVALAVEVRALPTTFGNTVRLVVIVTLMYVALGVAASVVALDPSLPSGVYEPLFALALAGGAGALLSVLAIAFQIVEAAFDAERRKAMGAGETGKQSETGDDLA